jgi:hypothetical protein
MGEPSGGPVRIWDRRSPGMEVVLVSNGGPTGAKGAGGLRTGAVGIEWDPEREGRIAVLERGGDLSIFDLVDPLRNEVNGSRTDFGLFAVGEPIRSELVDRLCLEGFWIVRLIYAFVRLRLQSPLPHHRRQLTPSRSHTMIRIAPAHLELNLLLSRPLRADASIFLRSPYAIQ